MPRNRIESVTPVLSILVFAFCLYAAVFDPESAFYVDITSLFKGFGPYFFAKGVFCCMSLYIAGKSYGLLAELAANSRDSGEQG